MQIEPFFLVYGRNARLPVDQLEEENLQAETDRITQLIDQVPLTRTTVKERISQSQAKQKNRHDVQIRQAHTFKTGDKVLYFNVTLDHSHSGKFKPKWKGPFVINQQLPNGAYKLATNDGQPLPAPINGNLLKPYREPCFF